VGFVDELLGEQVDLAQVRLCRIRRHLKEVLDGDARVCVALDADALQQGDLLTWLFAEPVLFVFAHGYDAGSIWSYHAPIVSGGRRRNNCRAR